MRCAVVRSVWVNHRQKKRKAEQKSCVRECGARVKSENVFSRSVLISWYISALPQYLERYAARYTNPLCHTNSCKSTCNLKHKWVRFCAERITSKKEIGTLIYDASIGYFKVHTAKAVYCQASRSNVQKAPKSVISWNYAASGKQVRECGARVKN